MDNNSQNSRFFTALVIGIIMGVAFCILGFFIYTLAVPSASNDEPSNGGKSTTKEVTKVDESKEIVYSADNNFGYEVPIINIDSDDVKTINKEISDNYLEFLGRIDTTTPSYFTFKYKYYENNEVLSLLIYSNSSYGPGHVYNMYNVNKYTGEKVSDSDILAMADSDIFVKALEIYKTKDDWNAYVEKVNSSTIVNPLPGTTSEQMKQNEINDHKEMYDDNISMITNKKIEGCYVNNNKVYLVFIFNVPAGSGHMYGIVDVYNNNIYSMLDGTTEIGFGL